jgi:two-component system OmpR family response regulator
VSSSYLSQWLNQNWYGTPKPRVEEAIEEKARIYLDRQIGSRAHLESRGRASLDGEPIKLTSHEYKVLTYLMHHREKVVPRTELVEHIYDQDFDRDSNTIEVFIGRLRKKIGQDRIVTERGLGYRLIDPVGAPGA